MLGILMLDLLLSFIFLLPIKDDRGQDKHFPLMTIFLIVTNVAVHIVVHQILPDLIGTQLTRGLVFYFLLTPANLLEGIGPGAVSMITAAFLHADWSHLLGNMFFLYFFGRKVEDLLGSWQFALLYLACTFISGIGSVVGEVTLPVTQGEIPGLGASGAITGVMAAYLFLYSEQRIRTLMMVFVPIPFTVKIPAWTFIIFNLTRDMMGGWLEQEFQAIGYTYSMTGFFAHLSGFVGGMLCIYLLLPAEVLHYRHKPSELQIDSASRRRNL